MRFTVQAILALAAVPLIHASSAGRVTLSLAKVYVDYCQETTGIRVARIGMNPVYVNQGAEPAIVPWISDVSSALLRASATGRVVWQVIPSNSETRSNSFWEAPAPDPRMFPIVRPGEQKVGPLIRFSVPLRSGKRGKGLPNGSYEVSIAIDHGPHTETRLAELPWKATGRLVTGILTGAPVNVILSAPSMVSKCPGPEM